MNLIAVTDIFGRTSALKELISSFSDLYETIEIIDPYDGTEKSFTGEKEAYKYFTEEVGLKNYIDKLAASLENYNGKPACLLGFSVGATAAWAISENPGQSFIKKSVCFYSSQIRNFLYIKPKFPFDIYFAREELKYNVDDIMEFLSEKREVNCIKTDHLHGFMNKKSHNFDLKGYFEYIEAYKNIYFNK